MDGTAVRGVRSFFMELAESLDVIRPAPARRYIFDKNLVLEQVALSEFRSDARRCQVRHQEVIEHLHMKCMARTGRAVVLSKNFVNETERLERRLEQAGIAYEREAIRIADGDKLTEVRYAFVADVTLNVHVDCDHDAGVLRFTVRNFDGLETVRCTFAAHQVTQARLDDLGRWWLGQPHQFLEGAKELRRVEAR